MGVSIYPDVIGDPQFDEKFPKILEEDGEFWGDRRGFPQMSIGYGTSERLWQSMGLPWDYCGAEKATVLKGRAIMARSRNAWPEKETVVTKGISGPTCIECGKPEGYNHLLLYRIIEIATRAEELGVDVVWA